MVKYHKKKEKKGKGRTPQVKEKRTETDRRCEGREELLGTPPSQFGRNRRDNKRHP